MSDRAQQARDSFLAAVEKQPLTETEILFSKSIHRARWLICINLSRPKSWRRRSSADLRVPRIVKQYASCSRV